MRRAITTLLLVVPALVGVPPATADEPTSGFAFYDVTAQAQGVTGHLFAIGEETNRLGSARVEAELSNVNSIAALVHRGVVVGYAYGATLGRSAAGGSGLAPDPPPGDIQARHPAEPNEMSWEGPLTAGAGQVVDGREHVKATETNGTATISMQSAEVPSVVEFRQGDLSASGGLTDKGAGAAAVTALQNITLGGVVKIERLVSAAQGLIPAGGGAPEGSGVTVAEGVTINGNPVRITSGGIEAGGEGQGAEQQGQLAAAVRQALAGANIEDIIVVDTVVAAGKDGKTVTVRSGGLRVIYRNETLRGATPQGFTGGGLEVAGATVAVAVEPCSTCGPGPDSESGGTGDGPGSDMTPPQPSAYRDETWWDAR